MKTIYTALRDGGTFRWATTQRRGLGSVRTRPATTKPMDLYSTA